MLANRNLSTTNRNYMAMLSFISHELKNHIAGSAFAVRTIQRNAATVLEKDDSVLLARLAESMNYLGEMVRNYLDLSRLEEDGLKPTYRKLNFMTDVALPTLDRLSPVLDRKNILVKNEIAVSSTLISDPDFLITVFFNLFHNAAKYTPHGGMIKLSTQDQEHMFEFTVYNQGDGIPPPLQKRIFDKFFKLEHADRDQEGAGLGLYITKVLVTMLGGDIRLESEERKWTAFTVRFPKEPNRNYSSL